MRDEVIAEIHAAFKGVSRVGGVSWNEAEARDHYASETECRRARKTDRDTHWGQLLDDPEWDPFCGVGGFGFLDRIGKKYYLPATMIKMLREEAHEWFDGHLLGYITDVQFNDTQLRSIARFVCYMARKEKIMPRAYRSACWREALNTKWGRRLHQS